MTEVNKNPFSFSLTFGELAFIVSITGFCQIFGLDFSLAPKETKDLNQILLEGKTSLELRYLAKPVSSDLLALDLTLYKFMHPVLAPEWIVKSETIYKSTPSKVDSLTIYYENGQYVLAETRDSQFLFTMFREKQNLEDHFFSRIGVRNQSHMDLNENLLDLTFSSTLHFMQFSNLSPTSSRTIRFSGNDNILQIHLPSQETKLMTALQVRNMELI